MTEASAEDVVLSVFPNKVVRLVGVNVEFNYLAVLIYCQKRQ